MIEAIVCSAILLATSSIRGGAHEVWLLAAAHFALVAAVMRQRNVSGYGMFIFMSFLFFSVRPIYILLESDYTLFRLPFRMQVTNKMLNNAQWWATLASLAFYLGAIMSLRIHKTTWRSRRIAGGAKGNYAVAGDTAAIGAIIYQTIALGMLLVLSQSGRGLYQSSAGAWVYEFPAVLQGGHILALVLLFERYIKIRSHATILQFFISGGLFILFTLEMREISMFRGFYLTGLIAGGIALLARVKLRVSAIWLVIPVIIIQPIFRMLGEIRGASNDVAAEMAFENMGGERQSLFNGYWSFYNSDGDINIFDTFVAAKNFEPTFRPYLLSWLYVPVHIVPRAIWTSKPKSGILSDGSYANGAPLSPGIAGFFLLDGGEVWMVACMVVLGYLVASLDFYILSLPRGYLRCCLYGIVVVNAMALSRFFLWQYFYQVLYGVGPVIIMSYFLNRRGGLFRGNPLPRKRKAPRSHTATQNADILPK